MKIPNSTKESCKVKNESKVYTLTGELYLDCETVLGSTDGMNLPSFVELEYNGIGPIPCRIPETIAQPLIEFIQKTLVGEVDE